jgi:hypothetical protein
MKQIKSGLSSLATHALVAALVTVVINVILLYVLVALLWSSDSGSLTTQVVQSIGGYLAVLVIEGLLLVLVFRGAGARRPVRLAAVATGALLAASLVVGLLLPAPVLYFVGLTGALFAFYYYVFQKTAWGPKAAVSK